MLRNKEQRREWIDNYEENYSITSDNGSVRILESKLLGDGTTIVVIQVYTKKLIYNHNTHNYTHEKAWVDIERYIKSFDEKVMIRKSPSELVEHLKRIKQ